MYSALLLANSVLFSFFVAADAIAEAIELLPAPQAQEQLHLPATAVSPQNPGLAPSQAVATPAPTQHSIVVAPVRRIMTRALVYTVHDRDSDRVIAQVVAPLKHQGIASGTQVVREMLEWRRAQGVCVEKWYVDYLLDSLMSPSHVVRGVSIGSLAKCRIRVATRVGQVELERVPSVEFYGAP